MVQLKSVPPRITDRILLVQFIYTAAACFRYSYTEINIFIANTLVSTLGCYIDLNTVCFPSNLAKLLKQ